MFIRRADMMEINEIYSRVLKRVTDVGINRNTDDYQQICHILMFDFAVEFQVTLSSPYTIVNVHDANAVGAVAHPNLPAHVIVDAGATLEPSELVNSIPEDSVCSVLIVKNERFCRQLLNMYLTVPIFEVDSKKDAEALYHAFVKSPISTVIHALNGSTIICAIGEAAPS